LRGGGDHENTSSVNDTHCGHLHARRLRQKNSAGATATAPSAHRANGCPERQSQRSAARPVKGPTWHTSNAFQHPGIKVLVEGHCDERGSEEYNLGLGSNRADAIKTPWSAWV